MPSSRICWMLHYALRLSLSHPLSVQLIALLSTSFLLSFPFFLLTPWFHDEYQRHVSEYQLPTTSFTLDHLVVFLAIVPPMFWLLLLHIAYDSKWNSGLLLLRVTSCFTVSFALTVLFAELLSRRAMLALIGLFYGVLALMYSWSVIIWKWYEKLTRTKGFVKILPHSMQKLLLQTSLLEWLTSTSFSDKLAPLLLFLLPLTRTEQIKLMEQMSPQSQVMMTKPGLMTLLPDSVQNVLLPAQDNGNDPVRDIETDKLDTNERKLVYQVDAERRITVNRMEPENMLTNTTSSTGGFDFHRPNVIEPARLPPLREQVLNEIVVSWIWSECKELVKVPTAKILNRTAAMSSALLVMQLYASRRSRRFFLAFVQVLACSTLSSVACCAILLRFVQLFDLSWTSSRAVPLLRYVRQYLLRHRKLAGQVSNRPAHGNSLTLQSTAWSVSVAVAAMYIYRKLRR